MKKNKGVISVFIAVLISMSLVTSCGNSGGGGDSAYEGAWHAVAAEMFGITLTGDDVPDFSIELKSNGKAVFTAEGESGDIKWSSEGTSVTLNIEGQDTAAEINGDVMTIEDILGTGMKVIFARVGSDADNPELYQATNLDDLDIDQLQDIVNNAESTLENLEASE